MVLTDATKKHVIENYVQPARRRGESTVRIRVGTILKELGWTNRTPSVFSTLGSQTFQAEAGVELVEKQGGPASGGPSTSWWFTYRILKPEAGTERGSKQVSPNGEGLMALAGCLKDVFSRLGGGEAYLKAEREWGPDAWEGYAAEKAKTPTDEERR